MLNAGADKVSINSAAVRDPEFVRRAARRFGSQCIVVNIDPKRVDRDGREVWEVQINGGRVPTGLEAVAWAREVERLGAGEIVLTSMDADGTKNGYDLPMTRAVADAVEVPVVASGGAGNPEHLRAALAEGGASAALAASIFHYREYTIAETKDYLARHGVPVRRVDARRARRATPVGSIGLRRRASHPTRPSRTCRPLDRSHATDPTAGRSSSPGATEPMATVDGPTTRRAASSEPEANKLFRMVMKHKGSDLHLKVGLPPCMRLGGVLRQMQLPPLTTADMERLMFPLLTARQRRSSRRKGASTSPTSSTTATSRPGSASTCSGRAAGSAWSPGG